MNDRERPPVLRKVAVMGAGAVGSFYGAMLARAGHAVTLIGRPAHVQAIQRDGLQLEMGGQRHTRAAGRQQRPGRAWPAPTWCCAASSPPTPRRRRGRWRRTSARRAA